MTNYSDFNRNFENTLNKILADLDNHDFIQSAPIHSNLQFNIPISDPYIVHLKIKIDNFFQQHSDIVYDIKNYFFEDFIMYAVKRTFDPSFTSNDITRTNELFNNFFIQQEKNIKIIFDLFFDDVKPLILKSKFSHSRPLYQLIDSVPKFIVREASITYLKKSGASFLTSLMYSNQMNLVQHQDTTFSIRSSLLRHARLLCTVFALYIVVDF
ncbi:unnamed protein product [Rotaria sp. Silwood1]|nr:unnamed protein product [Rotaria sp. Silwood1]